MNNVPTAGARAGTQDLGLRGSTPHVGVTVVDASLKIKAPIIEVRHYDFVAGRLICFGWSLYCHGQAPVHS